MWNKIKSWFKKEEKKTVVTDRVQPTITLPPKAPMKNSMGKASQVSSTPSYVTPTNPSFQDNIVPYLVLDSFESHHKESATEPSYSSHRNEHPVPSYNNSDDSSSRSSYSSSSDYGSSSSSSSDYSSSSDSGSSSYSSD